MASTKTKYADGSRITPELDQEAIEIVDLILQTLKGRRFSLYDEIELQAELETCLKSLFEGLSREYQLSAGSRIDFFHKGIGTEVKIQGGKKDIYNQCARYCSSDQIKALILVTNKSMGFPPSINGKPCFVFNLSKAWL